MDFQLVTNYDNLKRVIEGLPANMVMAELAVEKQIHMIGNDILTLMREPGRPITYPVNWDTEKQRKAYFATDGFGGGIPSSRTDLHINAWEQLPIQAGEVVQNLEDTARFIYGTLKGGDRPATGGQSRIHQGRWPKFHDAVGYVLGHWSAGGWEEVRTAMLEGFLSFFRK